MSESDHFFFTWAESYTGCKAWLLLTPCQGWVKEHLLRSEHRCCEKSHLPQKQQSWHVSSINPCSSESQSATAKCFKAGLNLLDWALPCLRDMHTHSLHVPCTHGHTQLLYNQAVCNAEFQCTSTISHIFTWSQMFRQQIFGGQKRLPAFSRCLFLASSMKFLSL